MTKFTLVSISLAVLLIVLPSAASDPKPEAKDNAAQEKAVKELVGKAVTAIAKRDIEALVEMSDVPWCSPGPAVAENKVQLKKNIFIAFEDKPKFDPKHKILSITNFDSAKRNLTKSHIEAFGKVLNDSDYVAEVEITYLGNKVEMTILIKLRDGEPRLVGFDC